MGWKKKVEKASKGEGSNELAYDGTHEHTKGSLISDTPSRNRAGQVVGRDRLWKCGVKGCNTSWGEST